MLELIKEKNFDKLYEIYKDEQFEKFIICIAPYVNKNRYFSIDFNGDIIEKQINFNLISLFINKLENRFEEETKSTLINAIDLKETISINKIDRLSKFSIDKLMKNIMKLYYKEDVSHSLRYSKELLLRDNESFVKAISNYVLLNNPKSLKSLMLIMLLSTDYKNKDFIDNLLFISLDFIIKKPRDIVKIENKQNLDFNSILNRFLQDKQTNLNSLEIASYLYLMKLSNNYDIKFLNIINNYIDNNQQTVELDKDQLLIFNYLLKRLGGK